MPVIAKITAAKKTKGRYHIYIQEGEKTDYAFSVSEDILVREHLLKGKELTKEEIDVLRKQDETDRAFQNALNYLSYRMRSVYEVRKYLEEREVEVEEIDNIIETLTDRGFLHDESFAASYVRTKRDTAQKGPLLMKRELQEKGIAAAIIERAMEEYTAEQQFDDAVALAEKKQSSYQKESVRKREEKLMQFLLQKGYPAGLAKEAVKEANLENNEENEYEAMKIYGEKAWKKNAQKEPWEQKQRVKQFLYGKGFPSESINRFIEEKEGADD